MCDSAADEKQKTELPFKFSNRFFFWHDNFLDNFVSKNARTQDFKTIPVEI